MSDEGKRWTANHYKDAEFLRKPDGHILVDGIEVAVTRQCPHCNRHFISRKGSGIRRGFCMRCNKITCGNPQCNKCVPFEKWLDAYEKSEGLRANLEKVLVLS